MRINSIMKANSKMHRESNNKHGNKHGKNNENNISFYSILKQNILKRMEKNSVNIMK
ncbi:hypothetical protein [Clostridium sp. BJN0013]|uniref:hypothetical protein n=1 Tax=Clostridium sp. BJN0013 TaxID=3236840 RepID=UPI0034C5B4A1